MARQFNDVKKSWHRCNWVIKSVFLEANWVKTNTFSEIKASNVYVNVLLPSRRKLINSWHDLWPHHARVTLNRSFISKTCAYPWVNTSKREWTNRTLSLFLRCGALHRENFYGNVNTGRVYMESTCCRPHRKSFILMCLMCWSFKLKLSSLKMRGFETSLKEPIVCCLNLTQIFMATGMTWSLIFILGFVDVDGFSYLFTVLIAIQGPLLFFSFAFTKRVRTMWRDRIAGFWRARAGTPEEAGVSGTFSTALSELSLNPSKKEC